MVPIIGNSSLPPLPQAGFSVMARLLGPQLEPEFFLKLAPALGARLAAEGGFQAPQDRLFLAPVDAVNGEKSRNYGHLPKISRRLSYSFDRVDFWPAGRHGRP
jgi:hypothetical protein